MWIMKEVCIVFHCLLLLMNLTAQRAAPLLPWLEKTQVFKKKLSPMGFFGCFGSFCFLSFFRFFLNICPEERIFRVFSVSRILLGASRL
jgi:hypothetical protein